jgi:hypothetical protein
VTTAIVLLLATPLLAAARWTLTRSHTAHRLYLSRDTTADRLLAEARRDLRRSRALGASLGHLRAWRDLLSGTASDSPSEARLRELDTAEERARAALADLYRHSTDDSAQTRAPMEGTAPWSG